MVALRSNRVCRLDEQQTQVATLSNVMARPAQHRLRLLVSVVDHLFPRSDDRNPMRVPVRLLGALVSALPDSRHRHVLILTHGDNPDAGIPLAG